QINHCISNNGRCFCYSYTAFLEFFIFSVCSAFSTRANGSSMSHTLPCRGCCAPDKPNNRRLHIRFNPFCRFFLSSSATFTNHHDTVRIIIIIGSVQSINEICPAHWVSTNSNSSRLTTPLL